MTVPGKEQENASDCNSQKGERSAVEHVRWLHRDRRLSSDELSGGSAPSMNWLRGSSSRHFLARATQQVTEAKEKGAEVRKGGKGACFSYSGPTSTI